MKKALISAAILAVAFAAPAFAVDGNQQPNTAGQTFEQRQARILKFLDARIGNLQEVKTCVQAAKSDDDLRVCNQKHREEMQQLRGQRRPRRGQYQQDGMMGPGGQGGPMGPGGQGGMMNGPQGQQ
jgi:hypothetical protein